MNAKTEYLIDLILKKLKTNELKTINLEKKEFNSFINFLIKNS